jgi:hypothetical protein
MKYAIIIEYLLEHSVEIEFLEKNLIRLFFLVFFGFLIYIFFIYFFKIGLQKKKFVEKMVTIILPVLLLSICIFQRIIIEYTKWEFFELEFEIKIRDKKIKDIKKEIKDFNLWKELLQGLNKI